MLTHVLCLVITWGAMLATEQTIKALMEGKIDPAECDKKEEELKRKMKEKEEQKIKKKEQQERQLRKMKRDHERKKWGFVGRWCPRCRKDECQIFEQVYGKDDTKWPEPGTGPDHCISNDCKDLDEKVCVCGSVWQVGIVPFHSCRHG